jgi:hypothetical protein
MNEINEKENRPVNKFLPFSSQQFLALLCDLCGPLLTLW